MTPNPGYQPTETIGKRVKVRVAGDPAGVRIRSWPADRPTVWARQGTPGDIEEFEVES